MKQLLIISAVAALSLFSLRHILLSSTAGEHQDSGKAPVMDMEMNTKSAVFAGGCFWCTEADFEKAPGVIAVISGYTGGHVADPAYDQVSSGVTGHVESVKVIYDPVRTDYASLLGYFWRHVDPTDPGGQFVDRGAQYRGVIFYADEEQRRLAESSKQALESSGRFQKPIVTDILPLGPFYPAEEYHQDYYKKNSLRYHFYRSRSGRDDFLEAAWAGEPSSPWANFSKPDEKSLHKRLSPLQYAVTQEGDTEPAFANQYWNNHDAGIYVDIVSGEPLFSSIDKFESGTGWPSFTRSLEPGNIVEKTDLGFFMVRTEVRSKHADSHLGHVFNDGPEPTGLRYCINSASLRFIPREDLQEQGYGQYLSLFR